MYNNGCRVFSKELKILVYEDDLSLLSEDYYGMESNDIELFFSFMKDDKFIVLENSGVKDINSKFIYEGDIVRVTEENNQLYIGVIEKYFGSLVINSTHKRSPLFIYLDDCNTDNCMASKLEVIGCKIVKDNDSIEDLLAYINSDLNLIDKYMSNNSDSINQDIYELKVKLEEELGINFNEVEQFDEFTIGLNKIYDNISLYNCYIFNTYNLIVDFYNIIGKRIYALTNIEVVSPINLEEEELKTLSYKDLMNQLETCINEIKSIYDILIKLSIMEGHL